MNTSVFHFSRHKWYQAKQFGRTRTVRDKQEIAWPFQILRWYWQTRANYWANVSFVSLSLVSFWFWTEVVYLDIENFVAMTTKRSMTTTTMTMNCCFWKSWLDWRMKRTTTRAWPWARDSTKWNTSVALANEHRWTKRTPSTTTSRWSVHSRRSTCKWRRRPLLSLLLSWARNPRQAVLTSSDTWVALANERQAQCRCQYLSDGIIQIE